MSSEDVTGACRKCGLAPYIILDKVHIECKTCFVESTTRRFRQAIGKAKLVNNNDSLLLAYSGGHSSAALLDLIKTRLDTSYNLESKIKPSIIHVDMQSVLCNQSLVTFAQERRDNLNRLLNNLAITYAGWPIYWTTIEMCMRLPCDKNCYSTYNETADLNAESPLLNDDTMHLEFQEAIELSGDLTDRQKFVGQQCANLIGRVAQDINSNIKELDKQFKFVLVGSSATQLANNLLVDVILGNGSTIRSDIGVVDERLHVPILRPMRDFSKKEVVFYLEAKGIHCTAQPNLLTKAERKACIQTVTEAFLNKLYVDYPSTYNTLMKTGEKLA